jgi:S-adenosylmethionine decarboxylase
MLLKEFNIDNYLFGSGVSAYSKEELGNITQRLWREMQEIFYSRNMNNGPGPSS